MNTVNLINRALAKLGYRLARLDEPKPVQWDHAGFSENEEYLRQRVKELHRKTAALTTKSHYWRRQCEKLRERKAKS